MKTKNLFLSLFACAAICACNKEAQPEVPQVLEEDAYINVSILSDNAYTKAEDDGFADGSADENAVKNILFAFFDNSGNFLYSVDNKEVTWTDETSDSPAVERISNAVVVLQKQSITPTQMVVVLNYGSDIAEYFDKDGTSDISNIDDMYDAIFTSDYVYKDGTTNYFTMSNSSYWNADKNAFAAQILPSNIYTMNDKSAGQSDDDYRNAQAPVEVYVERVAAKLSVKGNPTGTPKTLELINGTSIQYYPVINGYGFTYTTKSSWLCKNIEDLNTSLSSWSGWNSTDHKRSYWANTYGAPTPTLTKLGYTDITGTPHATNAYEVYCHENTTEYNPKLMVAASLKKMEGGSPAEGDPALEVVRVGTNDYYVKEELLGAIAAKFVAADITNTKTDPAGTFTADCFTFKTSTSGVSYESDIVINSEVATVAEDKATQASEILSSYKNVLYWGSQIYFFTDVNHFGTEATGTDKGVVRNHYYQLNVTKIAGLGTPFVPGIGGGGNIIDPELPENVEHELQARINILKWKVVTQEVKFE